MSPHAELTRLAARKIALRGEIAVRRAQCRRAASRVLEPVAWFDRILAGWKAARLLARQRITARDVDRAQKRWPTVQT